MLIKATLVKIVDPGELRIDLTDHGRVKGVDDGVGVGRHLKRLSIF